MLSNDKQKVIFGVAFPIFSHYVIIDSTRWCEASIDKLLGHQLRVVTISVQSG